jgi:hypothetical protein
MASAGVTIISITKPNNMALDGSPLTKSEYKRTNTSSDTPSNEAKHKDFFTSISMWFG